MGTRRDPAPFLGVRGVCAHVRAHVASASSSASDDDPDGLIGRPARVASRGHPGLKLGSCLAGRHRAGVGGHARDVSGYGLDETAAGRRVVARRRGERLRHDDPRAIDRPAHTQANSQRGIWSCTSGAPSNSPGHCVTVAADDTSGSGIECRAGPAPTPRIRRRRRPASAPTHRSRARGLVSSAESGTAPDSRWQVAWEQPSRRRRTLALSGYDQAHPPGWVRPAI